MNAAEVFLTTADQDWTPPAGIRRIPTLAPLPGTGLSVQLGSVHPGWGRRRDDRPPVLSTISHVAVVPREVFPVVLFSPGAPVWDWEWDPDLSTERHR